MPFTKNDPNINKNGRPKGSVSIVDAIKRKLEEKYPDATNEEKRTYLDMIIQKIFDKGLEGDVNMLKDMINRVDGMPVQGIDHTTQGKPIYLPSEVIYKESGTKGEEE